MKTTVVIVTHNRIDTLLHTLRQLTDLPEQPPLIVVDNGSTDDTAARVRAGFPAVRLVSLSPGIGCAARNEGVKLVETPLVAFCDDDSYWQPGALSRAERHFAHYPHLGVIGGRVLLGPDQRLEPVCEAMRDSPLSDPNPLPGPAILGFVCCAAVVRTAAFRAIGGFHRWFALAGEERLFSVDMRVAGWSLAYCADVTARHFPSPVRSQSRRIQLLTRDTLWYYWLRRPLRYAWLHTRHILTESRTDPDRRAGFRAALRRLPALLLTRRVVPPGVEEQIRRIESFY